MQDKAKRILNAIVIFFYSKTIVIDKLRCVTFVIIINVIIVHYSTKVYYEEIKSKYV